VNRAANCHASHWLSEIFFDPPPHLTQKGGHDLLDTPARAKYIGCGVGGIAQRRLERLEQPRRGVRIHYRVNIARDRHVGEVHL
jgi:hypothetical protein